MSNEKLDLGICIVGKNLNVTVVRGFATLASLAGISGPDVYDPYKNELGTQRALDKKHALESFSYASGAEQVESTIDPRAFPEVILNARDESLIEFSDASTGEPLHAGELDELFRGELLRPVRVAVNMDGIKFPIDEFDPQISRVDGNHRLSGIDFYEESHESGAEADVVEAEGDGTVSDIQSPQIPFALYVGLNRRQEIKLFTDINGQHKGMDVTLLAHNTVVLMGEGLKEQESRRGLWLAQELAQPGNAFEGIVHLGGSSEGYKEKYGKTPPLKLNSLESAIKVLLASAPVMNAHYRMFPDVMLQQINTYFSAVKEVFADAWADKKNFILLQSIGLNGFSRLGGHLIDLSIHDGTIDFGFFESYLKAVRKQVSLNREDWKGVAGAGGATLVAEKLIGAATKEAAHAEKIAGQVLKPAPTIG